MKKVILLLLLLIITCSFMLSTGCSKTRDKQTSDTESSAPANEKTAFNPDEPAPVPEGTPPY